MSSADRYPRTDSGDSGLSAAHTGAAAAADAAADAGSLQAAVVALAALQRDGGVTPRAVHTCAARVAAHYAAAADHAEAVAGALADADAAAGGGADDDAGGEAVEPIEAVFVRPLMQEALAPAVRRMLAATGAGATPNDFLWALHAVDHVALAAAAALRAAAPHGAPAAWLRARGAGADGRRADLAGGAAALALALAPGASMWARLRAARLNCEVLEDAAAADPRGGSYEAYGVPEARACGWAAPRGAEAELEGRPQRELPRGAAADDGHLVNVVNRFGEAGGVTSLRALLGAPDALGVEGARALLGAAAALAPLLLPRRKAELAPAVGRTLAWLASELAASPDGGWGRFDDPGARPPWADAGRPGYAVALPALRLAAKALEDAEGPERAAAAAGHVQRDLVLRLLRADSFAAQLAGAKELASLLARADAEASRPGGASGPLAAALRWSGAHDAPALLLGANLHQAQYVEFAQRCLIVLARHGALGEAAVARLWDVAADGATFEDIRSAALGMLGALGPHVEPAAADALLARLQARAAAPGCAPADATRVVHLLLDMARRDAAGAARLAPGVVRVLLAVALRTAAPADVAAVAGDALAEAAALYVGAPGAHAVAIAEACAAALESGEGAAPAARALTLMLAGGASKAGVAAAVMAKLNHGGALIARVVRAHTAFLARQWRAAGGGAPPPVGPLSHDAAARAWHDLLVWLWTSANFFIERGQMEAALGWATAPAAPPADAARAWGLLTSLVLGRKEVQPATAAPFLLECLCGVDPGSLPPPGWRCVTAYLAAATTDWVAVRLPADCADYSDWVAAGPPGAALGESPAWRARGFLAQLATEGGPAVAPAAARLLARLHTVLAARALPAAEHAAQLRAEAEARLVELAGLAAPLLGAPPPAARAWHDAPRAGGGGAAGADLPPAARLVRHIEYLQTLVREAMCCAMPSVYGHGSSYAGRAVAVSLYLTVPPPSPPPPLAVIGPAPPPPPPPPRATVAAGANTYVGALRLAAHAALAAALPPGAGPERLRLLCGGRELKDDAQTLAEARALGVAVQVMVSPKANAFTTLTPEVRAALDAASPAAALAAAPGAHALLLALAAPGLHPGDAGGELPAAARRLLGELPTCPAAAADLSALLAAPDAAPRLRALLAPAGEPAGAVTLYALQTLCALCLPAARPAAAGPPPPAAAAAARRRLVASGAAAELVRLLAENVSLGDAAVAAGAHDAMALLLEEVVAPRAAAPARGGAPSPHVPSPPAPLPGAAAAAAAASPAPAPAGGPQAMLAATPEAAPAASGGGDAAVATRPGSAAGGGGGGEAEAGAEAERAEALRALGAPAARYGVAVLAAALRGFAPPGAPAAGFDAAAAGGADAAATVEAVLRLLERVLPADAGALAAALGGGGGGGGADDVLRALLAHDDASLRRAAAAWLRRLAADAGAPARRWALERVAAPLLLAPPEGGAPEEQREVCAHFLEHLPDEDEPLARALLAQLIERLGAAVDGGRPVEALAAAVLALVQRLDARGAAAAAGLPDRLVRRLLFPEAFALAAHAEAVAAAQAEAAAAAAAAAAAPDPAAGGDADMGDEGGAPAGPPPPPSPPPAVVVPLPEADELVERARRVGPGCRAAAFALLGDLMAHDARARAAGAAALAAAHAAGGAALPRAWANAAPPLPRPAGAHAGLVNAGATCYMSAVFQQLFAVPGVRAALLAAPVSAAALAAADPEPLPQAQALFAALAAGAPPWHEPRGFWRAFKDYDGAPVNVREHQDAYEFFTRLQDTLDEALAAAGRPRALRAALGGRFAQVISVAGRPDLRSERDEDFFQLSLDVRGKRGLADALGAYVSPERMDGADRWHCEALGRKVDAEKRTLIRALPATLVLHLKRFEWDFDTYQRWKVKDRFEFPAAIDMRPYTVEGADDAAAAAAAAGAAAPADAAAAGGAAAAAEKRCMYELRGVVVHSGTAFAGHYYSLVRDRAPPGRWWCFDDTAVEAWDPSALEADCFGGAAPPAAPGGRGYERPNSAYMLFYERADGGGAGGGAGGAGAGGRAEAPAAADGPAPMAASPAAAAAGAGAAGDEPGLVHGMQPALAWGVAEANVRALAAARLLAPEYGAFHVRLACAARAAGGRPRKAPRLAGAGASPASAAPAPAASPGRGGGEGGGDGDDAAGALAALCLDYVLRVLARGPRELFDATHRKKGSLLGALSTVAGASPAAAAAVLAAVGGGAGVPSGAAERFCDALLRAPDARLRDRLGGLVGHALEGDGSPGRADGAAALGRLLAAGGLALAAPPRAPAAHPEALLDALGAAADAGAHDRVFAAAVPALVDAAGRVAARWERAFAASVDSRPATGWGRSFLAALSCALRQFNPAASPAAAPNPFVLPQPGGRARGRRAPPPLPPQLAAAVLDPAGDVVRAALMPGCLARGAPGELLCWMWWENEGRHDELAAAFLAHVGELVADECAEELAIEARSLVRAATLGDALHEARVEDVLLGTAAGVRGAAPPKGLLRLAGGRDADSDDLLTRAMAVALLAGVLAAAPGAAAAALAARPGAAAALGRARDFVAHLEARLARLPASHDLCQRWEGLADAAEAAGDSVEDVLDLGAARQQLEDAGAPPPAGGGGDFEAWPPYGGGWAAPAGAGGGYIAAGDSAGGGGAAAAAAGGGFAPRGLDGATDSGGVIDILSDGEASGGGGGAGRSP